ncbi:MAG: hypothetical protein WCO57_16405, partial [Verrucomicrobiota bacterium]
MPSLRLVTLAVLLAAPHAAFAADYVSPNYNLTPATCCKCITVTIGQGGATQSLAQKPDKPLIPAAKEKNGNYSLGDVNLTIDKNCLTDNSVIGYYVESDSDPKVSTDLVSVPLGNFENRDGIKTARIDVTISGSKAKEGMELGAKRWKLMVTCTGTKSPESCPTYFTINSCQSCETCQTSSACPSASNGCFIGYIPLGASNAGDTTGFLRFYTPDLTNPGTAGIIALVPSTFTVNRDGNGCITSVVSPVNTITLTPSATAFDPNAFTLTHSHNNTPFRTTTISRVQVSGTTYLCLDSTYDNSTFRYRQSQPDANTCILDSGPVVDGVFSPMRTETRVISVPVPGKEVHRDTVKENNITVSDIETTWENFAWCWEKTQEIIDPSGSHLTSNWVYFQPGESTTGGYGLLKQYTRYDGYEEVHSYQFNGGNDFHLVQLPFAGNLQGLTNTLTWNSNTSTITINRTVSGKTLSEKSVAFNEAANSIKAITKTSSAVSPDTSLTEEITYIPYGTDFGGQPSLITHPDGTLTTYTYSRQGDGGKTVTVKNGSISTPSVNGGTLTYGTTTITIYNANGTPVLRTATLTVPNAGTVTTESFEVTQQDAFGRAEKTSYFPSGNTKAWEILTSYSCCGISSSTDRHGVETTYTYDGLRRQNKATTLNVATETVYNGLTTTTKRNSEVIAVSVRDLAGTYRESWSPNPAATADVPLVAT